MCGVKSMRSKCYDLATTLKKEVKSKIRLSIKKRIIVNNTFNEINRTEKTEKTAELEKEANYSGYGIPRR
jgi:hypothetical protein